MGFAAASLIVALLAPAASATPLPRAADGIVIIENGCSDDRHGIYDVTVLGVRQRIGAQCCPNESGGDLYDCESW